MTPAVPRQRVIPMGGWITAGVIFLLGFLICNVVFIRENHAPVPVRIIVPVLFPALLSGYALLIAYVYGDARRRGMRYVMWTLLAIFLVNGIGIILYFILREPLMVYCSRCGAGGTAQPCILPALWSRRAALLPRRVTAPYSLGGLTAPGAEISCKAPPPMGYNP